MKTVVSLLYNESNGRLILFHYDPSLPLSAIQTELSNIKYFFGYETKVIISSEGYVDELLQQCDSIPYDAYMLDSDGTEVLNQAAENILAGNFYLSKNVLKGYLKCRGREHGHQ